MLQHEYSYLFSETTSYKHLTQGNYQNKMSFLRKYSYRFATKVKLKDNGKETKNYY